MAKAPRQFQPQRRGFFADLLGDALTPITDMIEKQVNPILHLIDDLESDPPAGPRTVSLPVQPPPATLRPPGALPPGEFENACTKCGKCVEVCPAQCIQVDPYGIIADGLPYIVAKAMPCVVCDDLSCMKNCPDGALKLVDKFQIKMGTAKVNPTLCRRDKGEDCQLCLDVCPVREQAMDISPETGRVRVKANGCIGCGLCENTCPTEPRAIVVKPVEPLRDPLIA